MSDAQQTDKINDSINRIKEKSEDDFEKQLIFIASGALAISFAFLDKLVNLGNSVYLWVLAAAWICLALVLCINLLSHYVSKNFSENSIEDNNSYCAGELDFDILVKNIKQRNKTINWLNYSSVFCLFLGLILLISFVTLNINHVSEEMEEKKQSTPQREEKGRTIPIPQTVQQKPVQPSVVIIPSTQTQNKPSNK